MTLATVISMLKGMIPILEPIGEQGINQLFTVIDSEIAKLGTGDMADFAKILSPALKQFAIMELQKLKA